MEAGDSPFAAAIAAERPTEGFITDAVYDWLPSDYLAVCLSNLGRFEEALERSVRALPGSPDRKRILDNLVFYADSIERSASSQRSDWTVHSREPAGGPSGTSWTV